MAYFKYKELTKYFYFYKELDIKTLPKYVTDYVHKNEKIIRAYATANDKSIFTTKKMVLFDVSPIGKTKKIFTIPYQFLSILSLQFNKTNAVLLLYANSGTPIKIKFKDMSVEDKTRLRELYTNMCDIIMELETGTEFKYKEE